jgi:methionine synthase / methylenetetrahydrofolate reductase (NADH)
MREPILQRLEKRIVVCDGAMGTMLYAKGIPLSRCYDELNLTSPQLVKDVHVGYVKAGAEMLETNTFGANRFRLEKPGLADKVREINLAGARLAREVAGEDLYVAGAVGPLGVRIEPLGPTSLDEAREAFEAQIAALVEGGVDLIVVETMSDLQEAHQALLAARAVAPSLPVVVQMTIQDDGSTPAGTLPEDFTRQLDEWGADLIGINCSVGPATVLETLERMAPLTTRKLAAQPNAGLPRTVEGRNFYLCSPEYMANFARRFIQAGARLVGGCCGTTPEHIKAIKAAVKSLTPNPARTVVEAHTAAAPALNPLPMEARSPLGAKLAQGDFLVLVEVVPPKGCDPAREIEGARYVKEQGVDAVNVPDGAGATARMSALTMAAMLGQRVGVDVVLHFSSQDRSVMSIQSDLLGAHALGIRNVLALSRDTTQFTPSPETHVSDVDSIGLVNVLNNLNRGLDAGGNPLGAQTSFLIGVGANPQSENMEREIRRFEYKVKAGANFALALPVFDVAKLEAFLRRLEPITGGRFPVLAGIWPLTSFRNAEFLNNEVPGITIPPAIMERMRKADMGDQARAEGVKIAQEALREVRDMVQGVQIAAPFGRYAMAVEVAQTLKQKESAGESLKVKG